MFYSFDTQWSLDAFSCKGHCSSQFWVHSNSLNASFPPSFSSPQTTINSFNSLSFYRCLYKRQSLKRSIIISEWKVYVCQEDNMLCKSNCKMIASMCKKAVDHLEMNKHATLESYLFVTWSMRCCLNMKLHRLTMFRRACLKGFASTLNHPSKILSPSISSTSE